ncbi:MAG: pyridoxine 5'-phosphate synthase [Cyclobacteriaceae bacterium]
MTKLSVNINKLATLRNARGGNKPDLIKAASDCENFGAQGITVHPRPDERHIRYNDVIALEKVVKTEFNIEGFPDQRYIDLVQKVQPTQATLVPDGPDVLTSNAGWDIIKNKSFLSEILTEFKRHGIRTSLFIDPVKEQIEAAATAGTDRIELYTEAYAIGYSSNKEEAVKPYKEASRWANQVGLKVNAGHDLHLNNLKYFKEQLPYLDEVSIGHALICDAIYFGLENTVQMYRRQLEV